jgi:hypothetical protein
VVEAAFQRGGNLTKSQASSATGEMRCHTAIRIDLPGQLWDHLSEPISRFLEAAPERIELASITRLWSRGNTLRLRLKAHETAASLSDRTDPALMTAMVAEALRDLVETHNVFIVGDPKGRDLDQIRIGP